MSIGIHELLIRERRETVYAREHRGRAHIPLGKLALALLAAAFLWSSGCTGRPAGGSDVNGGVSDAPIKIGTFLSTTGDEATFGISTMNGINMAVDEINARGGVLGKELVVITEDDQSQAANASYAVQKLIRHDNVDVILGEVNSKRSKAGAEIAQGERVPMLTPSSTNPQVTENKDYVFRACFVDSFQGHVMGRFAREFLYARTAAILTDRDNDYAVGLAKYFKDTFEKMGGRVLDEQFYEASEKNFEPQISALKALNPDVLFVPGYYNEVGIIARQARRLGYERPLLGGDGWNSPSLAQVAGKALNNCYYSVHVDLRSERSEVRTFVNRYKSRYNTDPDTLGALAYDSVYLLADAYKRAGVVDRQKLRDALASTRNFRGVTGSITMTPERNPSKPAVVVKYVDGVNEHVTTIYPVGMAPSEASSPVPTTLAPATGLR